MKKNLKLLSLLALVTLGIAFSFTSCDKALTLNLSKDYANVDLTITAPQTAGTIVIEKEVISDLEQLASSQGFDINKIESATIESVTLKINDTDPSPVTTAIIDNAKISLSADNVSVTEIASDDNVHTSADQMDFDLKGIDIAPYLKSSKFKIKAEITTNAPINHDVPINLSMSCKFKVAPLKK